MEKIIEKSAFVFFEYIEKYFPIVQISMLSLEDEFLKFNPQNNEQCVFRENLIKVIESKLPDFRAQAISPSILIQEGEKSIYYNEDEKPGTGFSPNWYKKKATEIIPEKNTRLGTKEQYVAFLGVLLKFLVENEKNDKNDAWFSICNQSKSLGHFADSEDTKHSIENTGSRRIWKWYDLANTYKIIKEDEISNNFMLVSGNYEYCGYIFPLVKMVKINYPNTFLENSVGWIVCDV